MTNKEAESMKQAAKNKRQNSRFRTAPDGRLIIDIDDDDKQQGGGGGDDDDDDEDDAYQFNDKQSQSVHSKYRGTMEDIKKNCN